jgi:MFS-type transporter involved in bile tolerance (Atg22 family)
MNRLISKFLIVALGTSLSIGAIESTANRPVMAQQLCQSYRVTREFGLYVYINAGREILTTLPPGNIVRVTGMSADGEWARIEYLRRDNKIGRGWVASNFLSCYQE